MPDLAVERLLRGEQSKFLNTYQRRVGNTMFYDISITLFRIRLWISFTN